VARIRNENVQRRSSLPIVRLGRPVRAVTRDSRVSLNSGSTSMRKVQFVRAAAPL